MSILMIILIKMIIIIIRIGKMIRICIGLISNQHILHTWSAAGGVVDAAFDDVGLDQVVEVATGGDLGEIDACGDELAGEVFSFVLVQTPGDQIQGFALESFLKFKLFGLFGQVSVI